MTRLLHATAPRPKRKPRGQRRNQGHLEHRHHAQPERRNDWHLSGIRPPAAANPRALDRQRNHDARREHADPGPGRRGVATDQSHEGNRHGNRDRDVEKGGAGARQERGPKGPPPDSVEERHLGHLPRQVQDESDGRAPRPAHRSPGRYRWKHSARLIVSEPDAAAEATAKRFRRSGAPRRPPRWRSPRAGERRAGPSRASWPSCRPSSAASVVGQFGFKPSASNKYPRGNNVRPRTALR